MSAVGQTDCGDGRSAPCHVNHWFVALTVTLATFMEVLDTSIANVALPYISGGLSVGRSQADWVLTSYLMANAIVLPLSGWLSGLIGRKRFYMTCVALFTISSALCGAAPNLELLILCRILQGIGGGGLQPSEQGILIDTFPVQLRGMAMAIYGVAVVVAPILGPVMGGYISDNYHWRYIFFINIPIGIVSLVLTHFLIHDPPEMTAERKARKASGQALKVDYMGIIFLAMFLGSLEILYSKAQEWDWFGDAHWRVQTIFVVMMVGFVCFVTWELAHPDPIVNLRLLADRNFLACGVMIFFTFAVVYGSNVNSPQMLQTLYGYDAFHAGLIISPSAFATMAMMPVMGFLMGRKVDARWIIPIGLFCLGLGQYWQAHATLNVSPTMLILPRCLANLGTGMLFVPLNNVAYLYIAKNQIDNAAGVFNMLRNEGSSLGIAVVTWMVPRLTQFHQLRLSEHIRPARQVVDDLLQQYSQIRMVRGGATSFDARAQGFGLLQQGVSEQFQIMAYLDVFWIYWIMALIPIPLVFYMKRSVAEGTAAAA